VCMRDREWDIALFLASFVDSDPPVGTRVTCVCVYVCVHVCVCMFLYVLVCCVCVSAHARKRESTILLFPWLFC